MVRVVTEEKEPSAISSQSSPSLQLDSSPYAIFVLAIRSPVTKQKYLQRLGYFLDFVGVKEGTIEERCNIVGERAKNDNTGWLANNILKYLQIHKERVQKKEIMASILKNYIKPIKLFCEQLDLTIPWKKITRGLPKERRYANDRAPTIEEIRRTTEYLIEE